ncbi:MAG: hypothetical protein AB7T06_48235 [Kofleriaceae bacterium]
MLRIASLVALLMPLGGCTLWFGGDDGDDECLAVPASDLGGREQEIAPAPLRDPADLTCDDYGGSYCDPNCGPCPEYGAADLAPLPSYGYCGHVCETYGEAQCAADPQCRVVLDADCTLGPNACLTNFMGCFPTDNVQDTSVDCWTADAWTCSQSNACTAYHSSGPGACPPDSDCGRPFELCAPEGQDPGGCEQTVACDRLPPPCPQGTTPGVRDLCYTGACIPNKYCAIN